MAVCGSGNARQPGGQQQRLGQGQRGECGECQAPTPGVGDQRADGNAKYGGGDDAEEHQRHGAPFARGAGQVRGGFAGHGPEHRERQGRDEARHGHRPDIAGHGGQRIGRGEQQQAGDEQPLAFDARQRGGEERTEGGDAEGEQADQQAGLGDADLEVCGKRREQADDDELGGQDGEAGGGQQEDRQ